MIKYGFKKYITTAGCISDCIYYYRFSIHHNFFVEVIAMAVNWDFRRSSNKSLLSTKNGTNFILYANDSYYGILKLK